MPEPIPVWSGVLDERGRWHLDRPEDFRAYCRGLRGQRVQLIVRKPSRQRSQNENRYYWGVVIALLAEHCGYTPEEMHEALKFAMLRTHEDGPLPSVKSTAQLSTTEFEDYLERIRIWAATELGVVVPLPNEAVA